MHLFKSLIVTALILSVSFFSCDKADKDLPKSMSKMSKCYNETSWDTTGISNALLGEWEWKYVSCLDFREDASDETYKGLEVDFKSDNSLIVKENGTITQTSTWKIVEEHADFFGLEVEPSLPQLRGMIIICDELVVFNNSYIDVCDNYFEKIN